MITINLGSLSKGLAKNVELVKDARLITKPAITDFGSGFFGKVENITLPPSLPEPPAFLGVPMPKRFEKPSLLTFEETSEKLLDKYSKTFGATKLNEEQIKILKTGTAEERQALFKTLNRNGQDALEEGLEDLRRIEMNLQDIAKKAPPVKEAPVAKSEVAYSNAEEARKAAMYERTQARKAGISASSTPPSAIAEAPIASTVATSTGTSLAAPINASVTTPFITPTSYVPTSGVKVAESVPLTGPASSVIPIVPNSTTPVKFTTTTPGGASLQTVPTMPGAEVPVMPNTPTVPAGNTVPVNPDTKKFWTPVTIGGASVLGVGTVVGGAAIAQNVGGSAATVAPIATEYVPNYLPSTTISTI